jgi:hypothetical protein
MAHREVRKGRNRRSQRSQRKCRANRLCDLCVLLFKTFLSSLSKCASPQGSGAFFRLPSHLRFRVRVAQPEKGSRPPRSRSTTCPQHLPHPSRHNTPPSIPRSKIAPPILLCDLCVLLFKIFLSSLSNCAQLDQPRPHPRLEIPRLESPRYNPRMSPLEPSIEPRPAPSRRGYGVFFWCALPLMAVATYVGLYLALVQRVGGPPAPVGLLSGIGYAARYSQHGTANHWLKRAFKPLNQLDRKLRPTHWMRP